MRALLKISFIGSLGFLLLSGFSLRECPEDPPRGEKKMHLRMVKVENGKKTVIDTTIVGDEDAMTWFAENDFDFDMDSIMEDIEVNINRNDSNVFIFSTGMDVPMNFQINTEVCTEATADGDSIVKIVTVRNDGKPIRNFVHVVPPRAFVSIPKPPHPPKVKFYEAGAGNVIDLKSPNVISYKKKDLKGGREKIEIIRQKPQDVEFEEKKTE